MNYKDIGKNMFNNFFVVFTCIIIFMVIFYRIYGVYSISTTNIIGVVVIAVLTSLAEIILHSKNEQSMLEVIIRTTIHFLVVLAITLVSASVIGLISWSNPMGVFSFALIVLAVYVVTGVINYFQTKKLADKLNEKLKERYQG